MTVINIFFFGQVGVNGILVSVPYMGGDMEVSIYGAIMYEIRFNRLGHIFTFTPQNNEFQLQLSPKTFASKMYGLCGKNILNSPSFYICKPSLLYSQVLGCLYCWVQ